MFTESVEAEPSKPGGWLGLLELFSGESDDAVRLGKIIPILRELVKVFSALKKIPKVLPHYNPNPNPNPDFTATCFAPCDPNPTSIAFADAGLQKTTCRRFTMF